jgi:dihydrofolate reductase
MSASTDPRRPETGRRRAASGMDFDIVVAVDEAGGIGQNGRLPWRLSGDMARFKALTTDRGAERGAENAVVMGRRTWDSLQPRFRPLPDRLNVVLTRNPTLELPARVLRASGLEAALDELAERARAGGVGHLFVIGGAEIFAQALGRPECRRVHLTRVHGRFACDASFPPLGSQWVLATRTAPVEEKGLRYHFELYLRQ